MPRNEQGRRWQRAIIRQDELVGLFGFTPENARRLFSIEMAPDEIAKMIRDSGAPTPWHNPDAHIVIGIVDRFAQSAEDPHRRQAQAAINKLRQVLPAIAAEEAKMVADLNSKTSLPFHDELKTWIQEQAAALTTLELALQGIAPLVHNRKKGLRAIWHLDASALFSVYREIVDAECGASADGPAVRFVRSGFKRFGLPVPEAQAIETAFRNLPR